MKYKKDFGFLFALLALVWPVFRALRSDYTPTQVILTVVFAYLGIRLTYVVYSKDN